MPWKECHVMDERLWFVARLLEGEKMAPLCAEFGISRKTGYKIYGCGRVARPFGVAPTDPSVRLSRTRLLLRFVRIIQRELPACERYAHAEVENVRATG